MKTSQIQRAIDSLKAERAVLDAVIAKMEQAQQTVKAKPKAARKPRIVKDGVA